MPIICYVDKNFSSAHLDVIKRCNSIIKEYRAQGFQLTLRQLYYQMVARDIIPNKLAEYKRLGSIVNDARLAGLIDWSAIEDRTRNLRSLAHWDNPAHIVKACAEQFRVDMWGGQPYRPEVWIEKDALIGVIEPVCQKLDVPFFSCRGYTSQSEMWSAAMRLRGYLDNGQVPIIFHLGDHDPSGVDMTRDIRDRLTLFTEDALEVERLALNMNQIEEFTPPPNPAKLTDSRCQAYIVQFGPDSWELDALEPSVMGELILIAVTKLLDDSQWKKRDRMKNDGRALLLKVAGTIEKKGE